ncbi:hypothetical protein BB934_03315 [Microvirga ossetica]|uniref:Uncharacterized protein n=1 Tax=Microvirga ossetica TaxID=1882682 RepID=A0A1B2EBN2_9HYPH|nr:hypothetical protein [Microvirga ossetica]ANY77371.1 hypothetical protein BB934_03315 [Microvirga ossetica]
MHKRVVPIVGIILYPLGAQAAASKLEQAIFRPRFPAEHFVLQSAGDGDHLRFEIKVRRTGETFPYRVNVDRRSGEGAIEAIADGQGQNTGIRSTFKLYDLKGLNTSASQEISHVSFYHLGRAFVDIRLRERRNPEPYTSPPSGVWRVSDCRTDQPLRACKVPHDRKPKTRQSSLASMFSH